MALEIQNSELFNKVVSDAIESAITNCKTENLARRWTNAIDRAIKEIQENPYLHYDLEEKKLVILSSTSNKLYSANGTCQCLAFENGKFPCWHRAAARIWRLYLEAENKPLPPPEATAVASTSINSFNNAPYLKNTEYKLTKIGNVRI